MFEIIKKAFQWVTNDQISKEALVIEEKNYCETRDIFVIQLNKMITWLLANTKIPEDSIYLVSAIAGEIGNNSFDHNLGNWPDVMGIFFAYEINDNNLKIVLADRGNGVFATLKRVKPELETDAEALWVAFNEKISGRAPENRGNGLKFVKESIKKTNMHLLFRSGVVQAELNEIIKISTVEKIQGCLAVISATFN
ncbi:hypothetical protein HY061_02595 [Candidatus Azambacteria bacterium]|nr:hypothetical protein [Candidatus Azambacteria bacterium]